MYKLERIENMNDVLNKKVTELELSIRAMRALRDNEILTVGELLKWSRKDLLRLPNVGKLTVNELNYALGYLDLNLKDMEKVNPEEVKPEEEKPEPEENPVLKQLHREMCVKARMAAESSFENIMKKQSGTSIEVSKLFSEHKRVMDIYEQNIYKLFER